MRILSLIFVFLWVFANCASAETRIKDIASFEGVRDNLLVGKGLVVGLNGSGDNLKNAAFTQKELVDLLEKFKINIQGVGADVLKTKNVASVTITATLSPFARSGSKTKAIVSAIGDATSLKNGVLLPTYLLGPDGVTYAVASGPVIIPSFTQLSDDVKTIIKTSETNGFIEDGVIIENEIDFDFKSLKEIHIALHRADFSTATQVAEAINNYVEGNTAGAIDPGTIKLKIPAYRQDDIVQFISEVEQINVSPDYKAKVVINEATGTIVMGSNVKIRPVAIAQGNLIINIAPNIKQKEDTLPLLSITQQDKLTKGIDRTRGIGVKNFEGNANLSELVEGLNKLGIPPKDLMSILYAIKSAGALEAEIQVIN